MTAICLVAVLEVLLLAVAEEDVDAVALQLAEQGGELNAAVAARSISVEQRLDGGEALGLDERGVHAGLEVVADLLLVGRAGCAAGLGLLEDGVQLLGVDVVEDVEGVDVGLVGRDGVVGGEVAAGELVHVGAGVGGAVDGTEVEAGQGVTIPVREARRAFARGIRAAR